MVKGRGGGKTPKRVVELLKEAVAKKSQSAVARESGMALLTVQRYLKGIGEPSLDTFQKLSDYFNVSIPWLRGEPESLELTTVLHCLKLAEEQGVIPPLPAEWWFAVKENQSNQNTILHAAS